MASTKPTSKHSKSPASKPKKSKSTLKQNPSAKSNPALKSKPSEVKSKPATQLRKKRKQYTEAELNIPKLNMITPAGVQKPKGKKKGKVFVDDQESMMTILAMVNADKEGQIESKMVRARQMEEIRQARAREMEVRAEVKKRGLEEKKGELKRRRKGKGTTESADDGDMGDAKSKSSKGKKRVSFG